MQYTVRGVRRDELADIWPHVEAHVAAALSHGAIGVSPDDVRGGLESGAMLLLVAEDLDGVVASAVMWHEDTRNALEIYTLGGARLAEWYDLMMAVMARYAREQGMRAVHAHVRPGLARVLRRRGWRHVTTLMEYPIDGR